MRHVQAGDAGILRQENISDYSCESAGRLPGVPFGGNAAGGVWFVKFGTALCQNNRNIMIVIILNFYQAAIHTKGGRLILGV